MLAEEFEGSDAEEAAHPAGPARGRAGARSRFVDGIYRNHAGARAYRLFIPGGYRDAPLPLVVMLHGCLQSPAALAASTQMNRLAEAHGFFVAYPEQTSRANRAKCWNWFRTADQQRGAGEPAIIAGLTAQIMGMARVDPGRVYVAGMSAGGAMAAIMAATYPDLYAAVGIHSGAPYGAARHFLSAVAVMRGAAPDGAVPAIPRPPSAGGMPRVAPLILFHGDEDRTINPVNAERLALQWSRAHGGAGGTDGALVSHGQVPGGRRYTRATYHNPDGRPCVEKWIIHGAGHAWAGGSANAAFTDPRGPDASSEMLRFFLAQS